MLISSIAMDLTISIPAWAAYGHTTQRIAWECPILIAPWPGGMVVRRDFAGPRRFGAEKDSAVAKQRGAEKHSEVVKQHGAEKRSEVVKRLAAETEASRHPSAAIIAPSAGSKTEA